MKQGLTFVLQVNFKMDLDAVEAIEFIFVQGQQFVAFHYPSSSASRIEGTNSVALVWTPEDTYKFRARETLEMDTRVHLTGVMTNPETPIIKMKFGRTLFKEGVTA